MKKKLMLLLCVPALLGVGIYLSRALQTDTSLAVQEQLANQTRTPGAEDLDTFDSVLETYVSEDGLVNYLDLQTNRTDLDAYNASIGIVPSETFDQWSEDQQIAYLINAYNSLTLKSIIDETPIKGSIRDILGVWKVKRHPLMQRQITLDSIEHQILRVNYTEPRIHVALVCAAISCPYLRTEAYRGEKLNEQLDDQVKIFLNREEAFKIDRENKEVQISAIFNWFGQDWVPQYGIETGFAGNDKERAVLNFISQYQNEADRAYLQQGDYKVTYSNYDWSLNRQS